MPSDNQHDEAVAQKIRDLILQNKSVDDELRNCTIEQSALLTEKLTNLISRLRNPKPAVSDTAFSQLEKKFVLVAKNKAELATLLEKSLEQISRIAAEIKPAQLLNAVLYDEDLSETPFQAMDEKELTNFIAEVRKKLGELESANTEGNPALVEKIKTELPLLDAVLAAKQQARQTAYQGFDSIPAKASPKKVKFATNQILEPKTKSESASETTKLPMISKGIFGKGFFGRFKSYAKAHPVKTAFIIGGIAIGVALFITGVVLTAGALAAAAAGTAAAAATATGLAASTGITAAAAPGLVAVIGGIAAFFTSVAALGVTTHKHTKKLHDQGTQETLKQKTVETTAKPGLVSILKPIKTPTLTPMRSTLMEPAGVLIERIRDKFIELKKQLNNTVLLSDLKLLEKSEIAKFKAIFDATMESFKQAQKLGGVLPEYAKYIEEYKKLINELDVLTKQKNEELIPNTPEKIYRERYHKLLRTNYAGAVKELDQFYSTHKDALQILNKTDISSEEKLTQLTPVYVALIKKQVALETSISSATIQRLKAEAEKGKAKAEIEFLSIYVVDARTMLSNMVSFYGDASQKAIASRDLIGATMDELMLDGDEAVKYLTQVLKKAGNKPIYLSDLSKSEFKKLFSAIDSIRKLINATANIKDVGSEITNMDAIMTGEYMPIINAYDSSPTAMARNEAQVQKLLKNRNDNLSELNELLASKKQALEPIHLQSLADSTYSSFAADISVDLQKVKALFDKELTEGISLQRIKERAEHDPELIKDLDLGEFVYYYELAYPKELFDQKVVTIAALTALIKANPNDSLQIKLTKPLIDLLQAINQSVSLSIANVMLINKKFENLIDGDLSIDDFNKLFKETTNIALPRAILENTVKTQIATKAQTVQESTKRKEDSEKAPELPEIENEEGAEAGIPEIKAAPNPIATEKEQQAEEEVEDTWTPPEQAYKERDVAPSIEELESEDETNEFNYAKLTAIAQAYLLGKPIPLTKEIDRALNDKAVTDQEKIYLNLIKQFTNPDVQAMLLVLNMALICDNPHELAITAAIKQINQLKHSDINVNLETLLHAAGFGVQTSHKPELKKLLQIIAKPSLLNKLNNTALKKFLAADRQILLSEEQIENLNNLAIAELGFGEYYAELKAIIGPHVDLSKTTFKDICAEHQFLTNLTVPITFASECEHEFKALSKQLPNFHNALNNINKKQYVPLLLRKIMGVDKKAISFSQFSDGCIKIAEYRIWFKHLMQLQQIADSSNPDLLKNTFGDKATELTDFLKQNTDEIKKHKFLLFEKTDLLLHKSLAYFSNQLTQELSSLKKALDQLEHDQTIPVSKLKWLKNILEIKQAALETTIESANNLISVLEQQSNLPDEVKKLREFVTEANSLLQSVPAQITALTQQLATQSHTAKTTESAQLTIAAENVVDVGRPDQSSLTANQVGTSFIQINEDHSKTVRVAEANGLFYNIMPDGNAIYERPKHYLDTLSDKPKQIENTRKYGYSDDEKRIIKHMVLDLVVALLKAGATKLYLSGTDALCKKAALYASAMLPPDVGIYINGSSKPFKPSFIESFEIKKKREVYKQVDLTADNISDINEALKIPTKSARR